MLKVDNLSVSYGPVPVLHDVAVEVNPGEMVALIGANNAGKSTLIRAISGLVRPSSGKVSFNGQDLAGLPPEAIVERGIVMVPEGRRVFPKMTVEENLLLGGHNHRARPHRAASMEQVFQAFPVLKGRLGQRASTLSGGEQQMLAIGRGLMARPSILLLDEPSLGLGPVMIREMFQVLQRLNKEGLTIFMSEQNVKVSLAMSQRGYVLLHGRVFISGDSQALLKDERVRKAYLGIAE